MRLMKKTLCGLVTASLLLTACAGTTPHTNTAASPPVDIQLYQSTPTPRLRVDFTKACVSPVPGDTEEGAFVGALLAVIVPKLLEAGFGYLSGKLEEMAKPEPVRFDAIGDAYAFEREYRGSDQARAARIVSALQGRCLKVALVESSPDEAAVTKFWEVDLPRAVSRAIDPKATATSAPIKAMVKDARVGFGPTDLPYLFAEIGFRVSKDRSAFAFQPQFVYLDRALPGGVVGAAPRFLTLSLASVGKEPFGVLHLAIPPIAPRTAIASGELNQPGNPWLPLPRPPKYLAVVAAETGVPGEQLAAVATGPMINVRAELVEPKEPKKWLATVAKLIGDSKADLAKAVSGEILPPTAAEELAAEKGEMTLNQAFNVAKATAAAACASWKVKVDGGGDGLAEWAAVLKARYDANIAAVELGVPLPYPNPGDPQCP